MSSKRQLKRLSLLQTAPFPTTPTTTTTAANGPADTPVDAYVEPYGHSRFTGASTSSSPSYATNSPAGSGANSSSRRQSTINYFSRDEQHSPSSSTSLSNQNYASTSSTSSPRTGSQNAEEDPSTAAPSRERAALTLVEKHADLLRFIAQKESKCLELRSQLAVHETELLELKRKWERIVSRGFSGPAFPSSPALGNRSHNAFDASDASPPTAAMLNGIRESMQGVGRFIAGFGVETATNTDTNKNEIFEREGTVASPLPSMQRKSKPNGTDHESNSSVSTTFTDSSSRLSQSSMSSIDDVSPDGNAGRANAEESNLKWSPRPFGGYYFARPHTKTKQQLDPSKKGSQHPPGFYQVAPHTYIISK